MKVASLDVHGIVLKIGDRVRPKKDFRSGYGNEVLIKPEAVGVITELDIFNEVNTDIRIEFPIAPGIVYEHVFRSNTFHNYMKRITDE